MTALYENLFNMGRAMLIVCEERTLKSFSEAPPSFEVVGWCQSYYAADRWVGKVRKGGLIQRRYLSIERSDLKWAKAREKGEIKVS